MGISEAIVISVALFIALGFYAFWLEHTRRMFQIKADAKKPDMVQHFGVSAESFAAFSRVTNENLKRHEDFIANHAQVLRDMGIDLIELKTKQNGESLKDGLKLK